MGLANDDCLRVVGGFMCSVYLWPNMAHELAMDEIDEEHIIPHPTPSVADYLCEAEYRSGE